jgi:hypothetical protein
MFCHFPSFMIERAQIGLGSHSSGIVALIQKWVTRLVFSEVLIKDGLSDSQPTTIRFGDLRQSR